MRRLEDRLKFCMILREELVCSSSLMLLRMKPQALLLSSVNLLIQVIMTCESFTQLSQILILVTICMRFCKGLVIATHKE
ncbi:unnamed protein product [Moneuplotes crassus]|uniref:Uncharacterized protein n=1 Tax=Euplotes crassus TaxID=5936 RepID=A0AAD2D6C0_EUPCR|nr:unnamed protein product [Moneuplotes crassus]